MKSIANAETRTATERHAAKTWVQQLKGVFSADIEVCDRRYGSTVKVIACIEEQDVIDRILAHLESKEQNTPTLPHLSSPETLPLFTGKRFQHNTTILARKPVKTAWHGLLRAGVQG